MNETIFAELYFIENPILRKSLKRNTGGASLELSQDDLPIKN